MGQEIERKFLVIGDGWQAEKDNRIGIVQAYLMIGERAQVRVRIKDDAAALLTIKGGGHSMIRAEYEYPIPLADARSILALRTGNLIEKTRTVIERDGLIWEIDVFHGALDGLVLAEVELDDTARSMPLPAWIGREVTGDPHYYNAELALGGMVPQAENATD